MVSVLADALLMKSARPARIAKSLNGRPARWVCQPPDCQRLMAVAPPPCALIDFRSPSADRPAAGTTGRMTRFQPGVQWLP
jgi:hypothetical protein